MIADKNVEQICREELEILQLERLKKIVAWSYEKSNFYRQSFQNYGVLPEDIQSLSDVSKLPILTRDELHTINAFEFLTLPLSSVVRVTQLGQIKKFYTKADIRNNVEMIIRCLIAANVFRGSIIGLVGDLIDSRFLDVIYALESIGTTNLYLGKNYQPAKNFTVETIITTSEIVTPVDETVSKIICINETSLTKDISQRNSAKIFNLFAPPEIGHAGMIYQCSEEPFYHVQEDNFLIEILDGELVITTLTAQALPLIRYRTGQMVKRINAPCKCGRTFITIAAT